MKLYEYIDEYIATECSSIGDEFTRADIEAWAAAEGYSFEISSALAEHRKKPGKRTFTTERVGMGPKAFYRVIETPKRVSSASVLRMHQQQAQELVSRWGKELRFRMAPVAARDKRAVQALVQAGAEMKAVATILHTRLSGLEDED